MLLISPLIEQVVEVKIPFVKGPIHCVTYAARVHHELLSFGNRLFQTISPFYECLIVVETEALLIRTDGPAALLNREVFGGSREQDLQVTSATVVGPRVAVRR